MADCGLQPGVKCRLRVKCRLKTEDQGWNADWRLKITGYEKCVKFMNISGFSFFLFSFFFLQDWNISFNFLILRKQWLYYLHWVSVSVNGRLRTATRGKMQTEGKMQIEDWRPGVKCRLKTEDHGLWKMCEIYEHFWFLSMIKLKKNLRLLIALNLFQSIYGRLYQFSSE